MIGAADITGLVLAGGRGSRMGGIDKGLAEWRGRSLAAHALGRLAPQVASVAISANRHLERHAGEAAPVWPDEPLETVDAYAGPLIGLWTGLVRSTTPYVATVPCDAPGFPVDLVTRLCAALDAEGARIAIAYAAHGEVWRPEPAFGLFHRSLADDLRDYLVAGGRRMGTWAERCGAAKARFTNATAFENLNTLDELAAAERR